MDARHPLTPLDEQLFDWFLPRGKPVHILLTKSDKLSRQEATAQLATVRNALRTRGPGCSAQLFSSLKRTGVEEVEAVLLRWLGLGVEKEAPPVEGE